MLLSIPGKITAGDAGNVHLETARRRLGWTDTTFFAAAFVYVYSQVFQLPFTPYFIEGDHMLSISNAMRMLDGEVIYRDFFHLTPPGTELIYAGLFTVFGVKLWILNAVILALVITTAAFIWYFSRHVLTGAAVYLPATVFLTIGLRIFGIDGSYRMFSVIFVLAGVAAIFSTRSTRNLVFAGTLCGLASFFVQPRGVVGVAGIVLFLVWETYSSRSSMRNLVDQVLTLAVAFILVIIVTNAYFAYQAGSDVYYFSLVEFVQEYYPHDPLAKMSAYLSDFPSWRAYSESYSPFEAVFRYVRFTFPAIFYYALIPLVYVVFLVLRRLWGISPESRDIDAKLMLLCSVGIGLILGTSAPTGFRLYQVAAPGLVIFVWLISRIRVAAAVLAPALAVLAILGVAYSVQRQTAPNHMLEMPAGHAAFLSRPVFDKYKWVSEHARPGEAIYEAYHPSFYFPLHLKNPTPLYLVRDSNYTPAFQVDSVVAALERQPPNLIVWNGRWTKPQEERAEGDNLEPLWQFISRNYTLTVEFPEPGEHTMNSLREVEIWTRKGLSHEN